MARPTFEELTASFNDLMDALEKSKKEAEAELAAAKAEEEYYKEYSEDSEDSEQSMTPLEALISNRINQHIEKGTFPTLEEAQAIHILDSINYRYNR